MNPAAPVQARCAREPVVARGCGFFSAKTFLWAALGLAVLFGLAHLAGLREFTTVLNGTMGDVDAGWRISVILGAAYIFAYLGFVLLVPTLLIAAALLKLAERLAGRPAVTPTAGHDRGS
jgi:hypothetical protein